MNPLKTPKTAQALKRIRKLDSLVQFISPATKGSDESPDGIAHGPIKFGLWSFFWVFIVFGAWSALAPIDSAAVATGEVIFDANKKTVQHLEGGIVKEILVGEGSFVKKGDTLIRLDETAAEARLDLLEGQIIGARATEVRLLAERDKKDKLTFPADLLEDEKKNKIIGENLDSQRRLFDSRRRSGEGQRKILGQKIRQYEQEIAGLNAQIRSANSQIGFLGQEIGVVRKLLAQGNASRPRLLALERQAADLRGNRGEAQANISRAKQSIFESEIAINNLTTEFENEVNTELKETQAELADLNERIRASSDTMNRIVIAAPVTGTVTGLRAHTIGGVINPGDAIMDIIPTNEEELVIEARVNPQDIDVVHKDLLARVRLSAYKARTVPMIEGIVRTVSADRFTDERTGEAYYSARIYIDGKEFEELGDDIKLYPGMPAEVLIVTGSRTFLNYMLSPISESFNRAFREQ